MVRFGCLTCLFGGFDLLCLVFGGLARGVRFIWFVLFGIGVCLFCSWVLVFHDLRLRVLVLIRWLVCWCLRGAGLLGFGWCVVLCFGCCLFLLGGLVFMMVRFDCVLRCFGGFGL